jgi:ribonuclease Z
VTSTITLTGTGVPVAHAGTAGPGALVQHGGTALQFDAGRATTLRLAEAGLQPEHLRALFITHHHSDHLTGLADVVLTRWLARDVAPLPIVAPDGACTRFVERLLDIWDDDIRVRMEHIGRRDRPTYEVVGFSPTDRPAVVWSEGDIAVSAVAVRHEPVTPSVAYRVDTPDGAIVISGDTRVCDEVLDLSRGAQVLVHEACRVDALRPFGPPGSDLGHVLDYHADSVALGKLAARADVETLVLTHLIPPLSGPDDAAAFEADVRAGGFDGAVVVGRDLDAVVLRSGLSRGDARRGW